MLKCLQNKIEYVVRYVCRIPIKPQKDNFMWKWAAGGQAVQLSMKEYGYTQSERP